jgi:hypothetical protein
MKKLSILFVFAAMFAFVACGPAADKNTEVVVEEPVVEQVEQDTIEVVEEVVEEEAGVE